LNSLYAESDIGNPGAGMAGQFELLKSDNVVACRPRKVLLGAISSDYRNIEDGTIAAFAALFVRKPGLSQTHQAWCQLIPV
jgi:hypothetical protein